MIKLYSFLIILTLSLSQATAQEIGYVSPKPLSTVLNTNLRPVSASSQLQVPLITWGGDIATVHGVNDGVFSDLGLNVKLFREDDFKKQVQKCLAGETPFLRGTMGMINAASDAFKDSGTEFVVIYKLTWSTGGDGMVV